VLFHPKQLLLFSAGDDGQVRVWDLVTRGCVGNFTGHFSAVTGLGLSPDGWLLVSGGRDKMVHVWDLRSHTKVVALPVYEAIEGEQGGGGGECVRVRWVEGWGGGGG
jgi:U3 small nucleolar RNA-associated protein 13